MFAALGQAIARVPLAVLAVGVLAVALGIVGAVAAAMRPDPPPQVATDVRPTPELLGGTRLAYAVDSSQRPGPEPASRRPGGVETTGGDASITGTVASGGATVPGATVRLSRWVDGRSASLVVGADTQGRFSAGDLRGGLWTVTAWRAPDLKPTAPQAVFIDAGSAAALSLTVNPVTDPGFALTLDEQDPTTGESVVSAVIAGETVSADGVVLLTLSGVPVTLIYPPGRSGPPSVTLVDGRVRFGVTCTREIGGGLLRARLGELSATLRLPACPAVVIDDDDDDDADDDDGSGGGDGRPPRSTTTTVPTSTTVTPTTTDPSTTIAPTTTVPPVPDPTSTIPAPPDAGGEGQG